MSQGRKQADRPARRAGLRRARIGDSDPRARRVLSSLLTNDDLVDPLALDDQGRLVLQISEPLASDSPLRLDFDEEVFELRGGKLRLRNEPLPASGSLAMTGNLDLGGRSIVDVDLVDGRDLSVDGDKLDDIEPEATADQTGAEIKAAYEANADTNAFTDSEKTLLGNQSGTNTGDEPDATTTTKGVVELATDGESAANVVVQGNDARMSDARTPTSHAASHTDGSDDIQDATSLQKGLMTSAYASKVDGIEAGATADQTAADIRGLGFFDTTNDGAGSLLDADKLDGNEASAFALSGHTHLLADVTDSGALAALDTVGSAQIDASAVTHAKYQDIAVGTVLGLGLGAGAPGAPTELASTGLRALVWDTVPANRIMAVDSAGNQFELNVPTNSFIGRGPGSITVLPLSSGEMPYRNASGTLTAEAPPRALADEASGTSFPLSPLSGQVFFRTDLDEWFFWDSTRAKWLGIARECMRHVKGTWNQNQNGLIEGVFPGGKDADPLGFDITIVGIAIRTNTAPTGNIDFTVRESTSGGSLTDILDATLPGGNNTMSDMTVNADASDQNALFVRRITGSDSVGFAAVNLYYRRHAT